MKHYVLVLEVRELNDAYPTAAPVRVMTRGIFRTKDVVDAKERFTTATSLLDRNGMSYDQDGYKP